MSSSATLLESAAAAARVDPREVDGEELMVMELDAVRAVSLLEAHVARVGAELEARGTTDTVHGLRTGSWVAREAPTSPAAVRLRIRAAQTVARHWPLVEEAWLAGDLSWEHIRALLAASNPRVVEAIAGIQEPIIARRWTAGPTSCSGRSRVITSSAPTSWCPHARSCVRWR